MKYHLTGLNIGNNGPVFQLDIYVSDKLFSETDDVDEFARNTGSVKLSSINRQDIQNVSGHIAKLSLLLDELLLIAFAPL